MQTCYHKCLQYRRRAERHVPFEEDAPENSRIDSSAAALPEEMLVQLQREQAVRDVISQLSPRCEQMITMDYHKRKQLYDRVQELITENLPFVFLAAPNILVGAKPQVGNFHPAVLDHYTLWNAEQLYLRPGASAERAGTR